MLDWVAFFNEETATILPMGVIILRLAIALIIVAAGFIIGRIAGKITKKTILALEFKELLHKAGAHIEPEVIGEHIVKYVIYVGAIIIALNELGITPVVLNIIFAGIIAVILIAIFLSMKDFVPNLISGIYILGFKKFEIGDTIKINNVKGVVTEITLLETILKSGNHQIMIPNSKITKSEIDILKDKKL